MESWALLLQDYGLTLEPARFDALVAKVKDLQSQYADPLGTVAAMMSKVKERLARIDSGQGTQATQRRIVAMLNDLIRTEEDKDRAGGAPQPNAGLKPRPGPPDPGGKPTPAPGPTGKLPIRHAVVSRPRNGDVARPPEGTEVTHSDRTTLPPLPPDRREQLKELYRTRLNERYRTLIIDYNLALARGTKGP